MLSRDTFMAMPSFETPSDLVFTTTRVIYDAWPILNVTHDADDDHWQFVNGWGDTEEGMKPILVHAAHLIDLDRSLLELDDLPLGWRACREDAESDWVRELTPPEG